TSNWAPEWCAGGATRARTSQGIKRTTMRLELWTTSAPSTRRPRAEATAVPALTARRTSDGSIALSLFSALSHIDQRPALEKAAFHHDPIQGPGGRVVMRSEERRVGKEGRYGGGGV